ncbi:DUF262 domain-containing protein [Mucilaginibacter calamicampi]|uniref:DUF262 domain-containing protein n=1 Tax=Mucilaginibacter calamicampi TaxID=1302352 RepID=A0ABW2YUP0_9SPHI
MLIPQFDDLMNPTLQALKDLGGEAHIRDIENRVAELLNLTDEEITDIHRGTMTKLVYRLAWSRNYLKRFGLVEKTSRGIWSLTLKGKEVNVVDKEEVKKTVKSSEIDNDDQEIQKDIDDSILIDTINPSVEFEENSIDDNDLEIIKPFDPKKIDITSKSMILDLIFKRIRQGEINFFTDFQRKNDLWDKTKQSRLIESILIRFPLPAFYFDGTQDNKWLVVDGLQRISSLKNFVIDKSLKLEKLEFLKQFNSLGFDELPRDLQRRIEESEINVYIINPGTPDDVKYNIFKRINTGGLMLEPQEIRHAMNQGIPANFVRDLAVIEEFRKATCYSIKKDRMQDRDFVTRFISFYINPYQNYQPDLDTFMNKSMAALKNLTEAERQLIKTNFIKSMSAAVKIFGQDAFRKRLNKNDSRKPINKALFEVWSVILSKLEASTIQMLVLKKEILKEAFMDLLNNDVKFTASLSSGTGDKTRVITRFSEIQNLVNKISE